MPKLSTPPKPAKKGRPNKWYRLLQTCADGRWYLMEEYSTQTAAYQSVYRRKHEMRPPGTWEFLAGRYEDHYGVWARNTDGAFYGADDAEES